LLTILPGQDAAGVESVLPRTTTRAGAESAAPGQATATSSTRAQAKPSATGARLWRVDFSAAITKFSSVNPAFQPGLRQRILSFAATLRGPPPPMHDRGHPTIGQLANRLGLPAEMESAAPETDFIPAGLASLGIEADEIDLAVMAAVHGLLWSPLLELLALDTEDVATERCPDLSSAPE
jgi:hypothetical protein